MLVKNRNNLSKNNFQLLKTEPTDHRNVDVFLFLRRKPEDLGHFNISKRQDQGAGTEEGAEEGEGRSGEEEEGGGRKGGDAEGREGKQVGGEEESVGGEEHEQASSAEDTEDERVNIV